MSDINLGPFRLNPRGEIKPGEKYKFLDLVTYKGSSYVNINNDTIDGDECITNTRRGSYKILSVSSF